MFGSHALGEVVGMERAIKLAKALMADCDSEHEKLTMQILITRLEAELAKIKADNVII